MVFDFSKFSDHDKELAHGFIGSLYREPDLIIYGNSDEPYLYRWWVTPYEREGANVFFHVQIASDPDRPLHDHPWDNMSVILSGGYMERLQHTPPDGHVLDYQRKTGDVIFRKAEFAHRLILPPTIPYTMTLFSTGPNVREWGFWMRKGWVNNHEVLGNYVPGNSPTSRWVGPEMEEDDNGPVTI